MAIKLIRGALNLSKWALCAVGAVALLLTALVATPVRNLPEMRSDLGGPQIRRFQRLACDRAVSGARRHRARLPPLSAGSPATGRAAIVIHGSSGSSGGTIHALSMALAAHGVETWAIDMRGHGASGTRGDIGYVGQLEDDLADFVAVVRKTAPTAPLTLIGHSAGGGFALRVAGSPIQNLFARTVLLAPYLGYDAPTNRPNSGGWASADIPRILGLLALRARRRQLLRGAAGACLCGAAEFREDPGADL